MSDTKKIKRYHGSSPESVTLEALKSSHWTKYDLERSAGIHNVTFPSKILKADLAEKLFEALSDQDEPAVKVVTSISVRVNLKGQGCDGHSEEDVRIYYVDPDKDDNAIDQNEAKDKIVFVTENEERFYTTIRDLKSVIEAFENEVATHLKSA